MLLILLILALTVIVLLELPGLIKNQLYREIWVFSFLFLIGTYLACAQLYQLPLPNPLAYLYQLLDS